MTQIDLPPGWNPVGRVALAADGSLFSLARDRQERMFLIALGP